VTIRTKQKFYKVRGPDGLWVLKSEFPKIVWVEDEHRATFWKKLSHLKKSIKQGIFSHLETRDGVPLAAFKVYEYEVTIERTNRKTRLTELEGFYKETEDGVKKDVR